ncbi:uncharacterized protein LOC115217661 [Octopus sinensis]|uniref:ATP-dependent DNA helicase n=1 Tax=Octopus sinensis TaxID=2607531 RepID=A0A6P7SYN4_9MOLL|nr:uncharacterized protein LOC115217661 [Octopus sinensis]
MSKVIAEECNYDIECLRVVFTDVYDTLNTDQKHNFDMVVISVLQQLEKVFTLSASGGTGKRYLMNTIIDFLCSEKKIVLAIALSGIVATLLNNDWTHYSRFRVSINITPESCCYVSSQDAGAQLFRMTSLIIDDEVTGVRCSTL